MVRVRFAPSPTGKLHLGSARTAVYNWLYARHCGGTFILRIEDTDLSRSEDAYMFSIIKDMEWLGLNYDEFYRQSERFHIYESYAKKLIEDGKAYYCNCSKEDISSRTKSLSEKNEIKKYDGYCRNRNLKEGVIRLNIGEERDIEFQDVVKNKLKINTGELDDFVIMKSDGSPTYNFAAVIDDALMGITHVIRGEDHITNTFKQIILYEYFKFPLPIFVHLPLVLDKDKSPLSKRKGSIDIEHYRMMGILPEGLLNTIARLGWSYGNEEIFTPEKLIEYFDIKKLSSSNAIYDEEKLLWVNGRHISLMDYSVIMKYLIYYAKEANLPVVGKMDQSKWLLKAVSLLKNRHNTIKKLYDEIAFYAQSKYDIEEKAMEKYRELTKKSEVMKAFKKACFTIEKLSEYDRLEGLEEKLRDIAKEENTSFGELVAILRIRLTGRNTTPDIITVIKLLEEEAKERLAREIL